MIRTHLRALESCRPQLPGPLEIIVVDNASADGTPEMVEREFPRVLLVRNRENLGFAMGCFQGLEKASGDFLLLLNPDCEANASALRAMIDFLQNHPEAGAVGARLVHADGSPQRSAYRDQTPGRYILYHSAISPLLHTLTASFHTLLNRIGLSPDRRNANLPVRQCDWLMGACIMVPRSVFEKAGSIDPSFFMYSEDAEWCRRIRKAGYGVYYLPRVSLVHRQKQSSSKTREFTYVRLYRSLLMLCLRHMDPDRVWTMRRVVLLDMRLRTLIFPLLSRLRPSSGETNRERLRATRRVLEIWKRIDPGFDPDIPPRSPKQPLPEGSK